MFVWFVWMDQFTSETNRNPLPIPTFEIIYHSKNRVNIEFSQTSQTLLVHDSNKLNVYQFN